jgi:DNA-binding transcriptional ArsR family regulator
MGPKKKEEADTHKALAHRLRIRILTKLWEAEQISPNGFSQAEEISLGTSSYHFRVLKNYGAIELVNTEQVRGATEHIYGIVSDSPVLRLLLATKVLENGDRTAKNCHRPGLLSDLRTLNVDPKGAAEVLKLVEEGLPAVLREIEAQAAERMAGSGTDAVRIRFGSAAFEDEALPAHASSS